jgi:hypothetical protein
LPEQEQLARPRLLAFGHQPLALGFGRANFDGRALLFFSFLALGSQLLALLAD